MSLTYMSWRKAIARCRGYDPSHKKRYTDRGITICEEWLLFENFLRDMGFRPEGTSLERIDNNKGYFPENCKWATPKEQGRNKENNTKITYKGETRCLAEWIEILEIAPNTIYYRLRAGWSIDRVFGTDPKDSIPIPPGKKSRVLPKMER